jgi:UDP-2,3-diacylglucosamine pyrophosphatase LpxH
LSNPESPFPYDESESPLLKDLFDQYKVVAHHGDRYDKFNFDREKGRDAGTIGDAFTMDVCNRYPIEAQLQYGDHLPAGIVDSLRRISNIRPVLAAPLWISGQIKSHAGTRAVENKLKKVWDRIAAEFLELDFVRKADKAYRFDMVDTLQLIIKISGHASFSTINDVVLWVRKKMWGVKHSFASHALQEPTFINNQNQFVVYGHTHQYEIVPLGMQAAPHAESQVYFNSGTWHSYYDLAIKNPKEQQFVPYQALTYVTFFRPDEHDGRRFETWSGAYA